MVRFRAAIVCLVSVSCFGQISDVEQQLTSGKPRDVAWAAYNIAVQRQSEMIPKLARLVESYRGEAEAYRGRISPEAAAIEAVADALIRLDAKLPAEVVMHLYPQFPAQTVILLSRASENSGALLEIFRTTKSRDLWLAAGNLLSPDPPPGFVRTLLGGAVTIFSFRVARTEPSESAPVGGGCAADFFMVADGNFRDWPRARLYQIVHGKPVRNIFAPGIHPIGFSWWETTDYRDAWEDGDCSESSSYYWRAGLMAQLLGQRLRDFPLEPKVSELVLFTSEADFEERVRSAIQEKSRAWGDVIAAFVHRGDLTREDATALPFRCRIQVVDDRPLPFAPLPEMTGRWCAASLSGADSRLP